MIKNNLTGRTLLGGFATVLITGAVCLAGVAPAMAAPTNSATHTPRTLADIQASGATATSQRIASLQKAIPKITGNTCIADSDRSTILGTLSADLSGMQSLSAKIAADTDMKTAAADYRSIFDGYRVYAIGLSQAHYAAAADCITNKGLPALIAAQTKLTAALAGPDASKSTPAIQASMADLAAQIAAAQSATNGLAAAALATTPAEFNANSSVLAPTKLAVSTAVAAVRAGQQDAKSVVTALR